jgi:DNA-binding IclR family transcriptional regulator
MMSAPEAWHVTRTTRALELLAAEPRSAPELAAGMNVHVRTARRVLRRLEGDGYVVLLPDRRRRYRLTTRLMAVAAQAVEHLELTHQARPHVLALRRQLGKVSAHLCVPSYLSALCLVHAPVDDSCGGHPQLRELVPCHCTAAGKALLAWRESWRDAVLAEPLASFTDRTITGPQFLRRELTRTVARGYSLEDREYDRRTRGVAAPVFSDDDYAVAALSVSGSTSALPTERLREVGDRVTQAATALSAALGSETSDEPSAPA